MPTEDEAKLLEALAECVDLARSTKDRQIRTALLALAQQWLDLAQDRSDDDAFLPALEAFSNWQMQNKTKQ